MGHKKDNTKPRTPPMIVPPTKTCDGVRMMQRLQELGGNVRSDLQRRCGPLGAAGIAVEFLKTDNAEKLCEFLPWLLTEKLARHPFEQNRLICAALRNAQMHEALKPILPPILHGFVFDEGTAHNFLRPAYEIARSQDKDFIAMAMSLAPEALKRASWSTQNFGNLACAYLDMDINPNDLESPVQDILSSQQDNTALAKHLCSEGFINLLNHPRIKESKTLMGLLQPYAGHIIRDSIGDSLSRNDLYILACVQEKSVGFAWSPRLYHARYVPVNPVDRSLAERIDVHNVCGTDDVTIDLFGRLAMVEDNRINSGARRVVNTLRAAQASRPSQFKRAGTETFVVSGVGS